jgi:hypothetical protein
MPTLVKVQIVQVPSEQRAQLNGATHACRHIADKLNNGERVVAGRDFSGRMQTEEWAATCGMCAEYIRSREATRPHFRGVETAALWR